MNAYLLGLLYAVFGIILLFFGARFMKVVLAVLGAYIGINIGQIVVNLFNFNGAWSFIIIACTTLIFAYLTLKFYKLFIVVAAALMLGQVTQALALLFGLGAIWAGLVAACIAAVGFFVIRRLDIIDMLFKFVTSVNGATALVSGMLVMLDTSRLQALQTNNTDAMLGTSTWWTIAWIVLFFAGLTYQLRNNGDQPEVA